MIINYVLILTTLLLVSGLVLDVGLLEWRRLRLQTAADATAQEAMYQLARGDTNWATAGQNAAIANGYTNGANSVTVALANPPAAGTYAGNKFAVQANFSQSVPNLFMEFVNGAKATIAVSAVAVEIPTCIWIMNPTGPTSGGTLQLASNGLYPNCGVYVATTSNYGICSDGFSTLSTMRTRVVGTSATTDACGGGIFPQPIYGAATKIDPLNHLTAPVITSCTYTGASYSGSSYTLIPGTYCGGTTVSHTTVTLTAGTYIFADGLSISNSTLDGTAGVTLYFTKHNSGSYTNVNINSATIYLKAPTSTTAGGIPGVVIFGDRNWIAHGSKGLNIVGTAITADGVWYILNTGLYMWQCNYHPYNYNAWIIDNLYEFGSGASFSSDFSPLGGTSPLSYEDGVLAQ